jgi:uncharacterized protein (TIGR03435 family)
MKGCRLCAVLVVALSIIVLTRNSRSVRAQSTTPDWKKAAGAPLALDTATVQLGSSPPPLCSGGPLGPLSNDGMGTHGFAICYSGSVSDYIEFAYKLWLTPGQKQSLDAQLPGWAVTDHFGIYVKGPGRASKDKKRVTMQSLLADRFKLSVHFETREMPMFALVPVIPGEPAPKLIPRPEGVPCPTHWVDFPEDIPDACGIFGGGPGDGRASIGGRGVTVAEIANAVTQQDSGIQRPILDQTGLTGKYDFYIVFTPNSPKYSPEYLRKIGGPTLEEALRDQLGLKLEAATGPVDVLVVDRIEKPTLN